MSNHEKIVTYNVGKIMVNAVKDATFQIINEYEATHPNQAFDIETLMCYLDETDDEIIRFFHDLALKSKPERHIAATKTITGKSLSTIERRVN